jgi:IS30 family transposase
MQIKLHANARTTPKTRAYIQKSPLSVTKLAQELGVNETTIRRWKIRDSVSDRSHTRHNLNQSTTCEEEEIIVELRQKVGLSLDDIMEVMHRCVNPKLSRSSIYRCLKRKGAMKRQSESDIATALAQKFEEAPFGYIHIDLKHLTKLNKAPAFVFVAIERVTRFVYVEIIHQRNALTVAACLERFLEAFPHQVHTILTDNGSEFTDRFAVNKKGKFPDKPSGSHAFDLVCKAKGITHKLTKSFSPQTNGMVERFNRRISEAIRQKEFVEKKQGKNKFNNQEERNTFIFSFVESYNRTRLKCLGYISPSQALANQTEQNTFAEEA